MTLTQLTDGDIDEYISLTAYPSDQNNINYDDSTDTTVTIPILIQYIEGNTYYIGLYGFSPCEYNLSVSIACMLNRYYIQIKSILFFFFLYINTIKSNPLRYNNFHLNAIYYDN
jgi:hypothetical protein